MTSLEFVRTARDGTNTVFLPGSTLKGALRTGAERLARTVEEVPAGGRPRLACNPLSEARDGPLGSCGARLRRETAQGGEHAYRESCVVCQVFGNVAEAAHLRVSDAYPAAEIGLEQRASVAVDRVFGNLAAGPITYEVVTSGCFSARLMLHNWALAHLGLVALALRDLSEGRLAVGYGKSRGLGQLAAEITGATIRYPGCSIRDGVVTTLAGTTIGAASQLHGVGQFPDTTGYGYPGEDSVPLIAGVSMADDGWGAVVATLNGQQAAALPDLWRPCVERWSALATTSRASA